MSMVPVVLVALGNAARGAAEAEASFRRESAQRIAALARERSFAYRRFNLAQAVATAVAKAENENAAAGLASVVLRHEFGWGGDSEAQIAVLDRFAPVAIATFRSLTPEADEGGGADVLAALAAFETWYAETHTGPFWALFDHYVPETPATDF